MNKPYYKKYIKYKSKYINRLKNRSLLQGGFLNLTEKPFEFVLNGSKINEDLFKQYYTVIDPKLKFVEFSAAGYTLYSVCKNTISDCKDNWKENAVFISKYYPFYTEQWEEIKNNPDKNDIFQSKILSPLLNKKYNQRKNSINETTIGLYLNKIATANINPCFARVIDYFVSDFFVYKKDGLFQLLKPSQDLGYTQLFCHMLTPYYAHISDNMPNIKLDKELFIFSMLHALYVSSNIFSFVHGDLKYYGDNDFYNLMCKLCIADNKTHVCYQISENDKVYFILFKLHTSGKFYIPILHDYGRSHILLNNDTHVTAPSTVYDNPLKQTLDGLKNDDAGVIHNLSKIIGHSNIQLQTIKNIYDGNLLDLLTVANLLHNGNGMNITMYSDKESFECDTKNIKNNIIFFGTNLGAYYDSMKNLDIYNNMTLTNYSTKNILDHVPTVTIPSTVDSSSDMIKGISTSSDVIKTLPIPEVVPKSVGKSCYFTTSILNNKTVLHLHPYKNGPITIVANAGGGDCFFYSIIDSGITITYNGVEYDLSLYKNDSTQRDAMVKLLREIAIERIKNKYNNDPSDLSWDQICGHGYAHIKTGSDPKQWLENWYKAMTESKYWANEYIVSALMGDDLLFLLINSSTHDFYCVNPFDEQIFGVDTNNGNDKYITFNSFDEFTDSNRKQIFIWYEPGIHFEYIDGIHEDESTHSQLISKYVSDCKLITKTKALDYAYKNENFKLKD